MVTASCLAVFRFTANSKCAGPSIGSVAAPRRAKPAVSGMVISMPEENTPDF
jgi:hypothetical protein